MFKRNKDGSLNLSIQAIVILVMAMAMLGLGLGFIRGLMGKSQSQFETAIDNAQLENPATASNPVTVDKNVKVKASEEALVSAGVYNPGATAVTINPTISCSGTTGQSVPTGASGSQTVSGGEARGYAAIITGGTTTGTFVCTIDFGSLGSKQFFVTVTA